MMRAPALSIFETDVRPQHAWQPHSAKYRVLWSGDLTRTLTR